MTGSAADGSDWQPRLRNKPRREILAQRFPDPDNSFQIVIVRDMWLTGFDAPSLHTMCADKPMRGHGLMQAIARVSRVFKDKPGGLVGGLLGPRGLAEAGTGDLRLDDPRQRPGATARLREAYPAQVRLPARQAGAGDPDSAGAGGGAVRSVGNRMKRRERTPGNSMRRVARRAATDVGCWATHSRPPSCRHPREHWLDLRKFQFDRGESHAESHPHS